MSHPFMFFRDSWTTSWLCFGDGHVRHRGTSSASLLICTPKCEKGPFLVGILLSFWSLSVSSTIDPTLTHMGHWCDEKMRANQWVGSSSWFIGDTTQQQETEQGARTWAWTTGPGPVSSADVNTTRLDPFYLICFRPSIKLLQAIKLLIGKQTRIGACNLTKNHLLHQLRPVSAECHGRFHEH
jgi:hypothetical protein